MTAAVCPDPVFCTHSWAGIPNRAAVLIAQGGVPGLSHPGVDRGSRPQPRVGHNFGDIGYLFQMVVGGGGDQQAALNH